VSASLAMLVNIDVEDLDTAIHFYESAIGLNLRRRLFDGTVAEMSGVSSPVYLVQKARDSSPSPGTDQVRDYRRHWTPCILISSFRNCRPQSIAHFVPEQRSKEGFKCSRGGGWRR
jgi:predicted lactoylglutathione lyase